MLMKQQSLLDDDWNDHFDAQIPRIILWLPYKSLIGVIKIMYL